MENRQNTTAKAQAEASYRALTAKVDAKFGEIAAAYPQQFACRRGCAGCCQAGLSVFQVEKDAMAAYLRTQPEVVAQLRAQSDAAGPPSPASPKANPANHNQDEAPSPLAAGAAALLKPEAGACAFLGRSGECLVYPVRPLICRSHGAPARLPHGDTKEPTRTDSAQRRGIPGERDAKVRHPADPGVPNVTSTLSVCPLNFRGLALESLPESMAFNLDTLNTILALINAAYSGDASAERYGLTLDEIMR